MEKNKSIVIGVIIILIIAVVLVSFFKVGQPGSEEEEKQDSKILSSETSPLGLIQNKEAYNGKTVTVLGAYIPSEAFIYIEETEERIYLKPANRAYCRNYDLKGVFQYNSELDQWELLVENYNDCLD